MPPRPRKRLTLRNSLLALAACIVLFACLAAILRFRASPDETIELYPYVTTLAGKTGEIGEPFGLAVKGDDLFISDGLNGRIWRLNYSGLAVFASGLDTPSAIAFDMSGSLIIADSGTHSIKSVDPSGVISTFAGTDGHLGSADGNSATAAFSAPVGLAIGAKGRIFVADTYNDRIRVIENGIVTTLAGGEKGYADGIGASAKFDTPCGLAVWRDRLLVADAGNRRIRVVEPDGRVWTLAGNGEFGIKDGLLSESSFVQPVAITVDKNRAIFVADGNAIRQIGGIIPVVRTISAGKRGMRDGEIKRARFNRPSGLAISGDGNLIVADSENRLVRRYASASDGNEATAAEIEALRDKPEEFRVEQTARWPYDPPEAKRDIAGTLGELRGVVGEDNSELHFHNGLDIAGNYGEKAYFIRDEKVLNPAATENFGTLRELIRLPELGYIHLRLGRDATNRPFSDNRFLFNTDMSGVRIRRGTKFKAGDAIGTLNAMNHVHLIAGPSGDEMNALEALILPGVVDTTAPVIEGVELFDEHWSPIETERAAKRIKLSGKIRVVVRAFDRVDGNPERRRLGVFRLGYQVLGKDQSPVSDINWNINFDRNPDPDALKFVYAQGSRSGATGETIFKYIITNKVDGNSFSEDFLDAGWLPHGEYVLRVFAADYFGNTTSKDISIEVTQ